MTESGYEGRSIKLQSGQQADGTWFCEYTIVEFRPTRSFSESGYPAGTFTTRDKAEAAALEVAQDVIDVRNPVGSPIHGRSCVIMQKLTRSPLRSPRMGIDQVRGEWHLHAVGSTPWDKEYDVQ